MRETDDTIEALGIDLARKRAEAADIRVFLTVDGQTDGFGVWPQDTDLILKGKADDGGGVSGKTGAGLDQMIGHITQILSSRIALTQSAVRLRHRTAMEDAMGYITAAVALMDEEDDGALVAMELNTALHAMNSIIGRVGVEDLLDEIFASFCLGK